MSAGTRLDLPVTLAAINEEKTVGQVICGVSHETGQIGAVAVLEVGLAALMLHIGVIGDTLNRYRI